MDQGTQSEYSERSVFDAPRQRSSVSQKNLWIVVAILGIVAIVVISIIIVNRFSSSKGEAQASPTPQSIVFESPTPIPTPEEIVDKSTIKVEVLNGTGIAREASFLQSKLASNGYEDIETGNADSKKYDVTQVTFYESFPESLKEDLIDMLQDLYVEVTVNGSDKTSGSDVRIITGLRPGIARPTPTIKPTPSDESADDTEPTASPSSTIILPIS